LELFEWTIEELSTLNPVNVVAHETQFREENDPEREAEAQAAISSFFSEHQIVPSPQNCQLRKQKIELRSDDQIYNSTALPDNLNRVSSCHNISKIRKIKESRDVTTQTAVSFPPNLPKEIEDLFKKYQLENDAATPCNNENDDDNQSLMMDISTLRRKLFIKPPESPETPLLCGDDNFAIHLSPAPKTPELTGCAHSQDDSLSSDMFGDMSPISLRNDSFNHSSPISCNDISMASEGKPNAIAKINSYLIKLIDSWLQTNASKSTTE
jgi:protein aurora borealis